MPFDIASTTHLTQSMEFDEEKLSGQIVQVDWGVENS